MGRLVAYTANRMDGLLAALRFEREALAPPLATGEAAWGVAFYQGDEVLHKKRPLSAGTAPDWTELAAGVVTDCALMHMREPTVGDFRTDNTHPFRFRRWTFAHQGTVAGFAALRDGLVDGLPDFLRRNLHGETDSEVFFHHVLGGLHRRGVLDSQAPPREEVAAAIMDTVQVLTALSKAHSDAPSGLTCVLTDGHLTTAVCQGAPLFYVERRGPLPDDPTVPQRSQQTAVLRYVMLTSGEVAPPGYEAVPQGCVVVVGRDLNVEVLPCHG
jgi:predicted glutamine amidotransferase